MDKASEQLESFLDNLLNWAFTQLNTIPYHPVKVDLFNLCQQEINYKATQLEDKKITISLHKNTAINAFADKNGVSLIVGNLLNNAIKFSHPNGKINIKLSSTEKEAIIEIIDFGVGISEKHLKNLFTLQKNNSLEGTKGEKGSGLGLILCDEFAKLNKGSLTIKSAIEKGTVATLFLPLKT